eukprot:1472209-Ditylum_brightwellii.AAC.1
MVKWRINTIFGVICIIIIIVVVSIISHQKNPLLPKQQQAHTTISCQVPLNAPAVHNCPIATPTMATQCRHQMLVPLSWPPNLEMAPITQGVCSTGKTAAGNIVPLCQ